MELYDEQYKLYARKESIKELVDVYIGDKIQNYLLDKDYFDIKILSEILDNLLADRKTVIREFVRYTDDIISFIKRAAFTMKADIIREHGEEYFNKYLDSIDPNVKKGDSDIKSTHVLCDGKWVPRPPASK